MGAKADKTKDVIETAVKIGTTVAAIGGAILTVMGGKKIK